MVQLDTMQVSLKLMYGTSVHWQAKSVGSVHVECGSAFAMQVVCLRVSYGVLGWAKVFAAIHTTHVGNFANSSNSLVAAPGASDPAPWAETVRAEKSIPAMVARCIMNLACRLYRPGRL
jgi:hypothetical protein